MFVLLDYKESCVCHGVPFCVFSLIVSFLSVPCACVVFVYCFSRYECALRFFIYSPCVRFAHFIMCFFFFFAHVPRVVAWFRPYRALLVSCRVHYSFHVVFSRLGVFDKNKTTRINCGDYLIVFFSPRFYRRE